MSSGVFLVFVALGAGAIALWIDARFSRFAPAGLRVALAHVAVAFVLTRLVAPAMGLLGGSSSQALALARVFGIAFPALVYVLLVSIWMIKIAQGALARSLR